jgi:CheY-like chemotaxis protein
MSLLGMKMAEHLSQKAEKNDATVQNALRRPRKMRVFNGTTHADTSLTRMAKVILLVEDSPDDELFCRQVLQKVVSNPVMVVRDGREAIAYLGGHGECWNRQRYPLPKILLLDLKLPKADGFEVLEWIKTQANLKLLIIVISHFGQTNEISRAYKLGADSFLTKPIKQEDVVHLASHFEEYWDRLPAPSISSP